MMKTIKFNKMIQLMFVLIMIVTLSFSNVAFATQTTPEQDVHEKWQINKTYTSRFN